MKNLTRTVRPDPRMPRRGLGSFSIIRIGIPFRARVKAATRPEGPEPTWGKNVSVFHRDRSRSSAYHKDFSLRLRRHCELAVWGDRR